MTLAFVWGTVYGVAKARLTHKPKMSRLIDKILKIEV